MAIQRGFLERVVVSQEGGWSRPVVFRGLRDRCRRHPEGDGIPPPDAGIHAGVGEEVAAVHLQFLDDVFGVAQARAGGWGRVRGPGGKARRGLERRIAAGDAFLGAPAEQAGMVAEGLEAAADLLPLGLFDSFARQLDHHAHPGRQERSSRSFRWASLGLIGSAASPAVMP